MADEFQNWRDALAGKDVALSADIPHSGYYKMRAAKDGPWLPVAIWTKDNKQIARVADKVRDPIEIWTYVAKNPVSKEDAKHAFEHGSFPGEIGHNSGALSLADEINEAVIQAMDWLKSSGVKDKTTMDMAANYRARLLELSKKADKEREDKKRPHDDAAKAVQAEYKPLVDTAKNAADTVRDALSTYMAAEDEKARKVAAEAARIENEKRMADFRRQQEVAAQARGATSVDPEIDAMGDMPAMVAPEPVKLHAGGQRGKKASLREITRYRLDDYAAALAAVKDHPDVIAAVEKVAFAQARAGATVPGVSSFIEKVAV